MGRCQDAPFPIRLFAAGREVSIALLSRGDHAIPMAQSQGAKTDFTHQRTRARQRFATVKRSARANALERKSHHDILENMRQPPQGCKYRANLASYAWPDSDKHCAPPFVRQPVGGHKPDARVAKGDTDPIQIRPRPLGSLSRIERPVGADCDRHHKKDDFEESPL